jgi:hypothetical protein
MKLAGAAGGVSRWTPPLLAQSSPPGSIAPVFPRYFRSLVPLAPRIAPFAATQAKPALSPRPQVANFSDFYNSFDGNLNYGNVARYGSATSDAFISRFLQYGREITSDDATVGFSWSPNPATADFALATSTSSLIFAIGTSATVPITVYQLNDFNGSVTLTASGLPAGMSAVFTPNPVTGTSTVLTLTAGSSVVAGTYTVTITGTSGSLTDTTTLSVSVGISDFSLSDSADGRILGILPGTSVTSTITVNPVYGFSGNVALSVSGLPSGVTAAFSPATTKGTSTLTLTVSSSYNVTVAEFTITGTSGSLIRTLILTLLYENF